jgi:hypothetical protein
MRIEKKTWPDYFETILSGEKKFDLRLADFECSKGDVIAFKEWDPAVGKFTGRSVEKEVTFVLKTNDLSFWPEEEVKKFGYQILSLK